MFKFFLYNYFQDIILFLTINLNEKKTSKLIKKKIYLCFLKSQIFIKIFVLIHFIFFKILTIFSNSKKIKLFTLSYFYNFNLFYFKKIVQLIFALKQLSLHSKERLKNINFSNDKNTQDNYYENIVIGSGPGGSVTALNLCKSKFETLILEKGSSFNVPKTKHPYSEFYKKWKYAGISGAIGNFDFQYASGQCLGGGSEINSGLYHELDEFFLKKLKENNKNNLIHIKKFKWQDLISIKDEIKLNDEEKNLKKYFSLGSEKLKYKLENLSSFYTNEHKNSMSNTLLREAVKLGCYIKCNVNVLKIKKKEYWEIESEENGKKKIFKSKRVFICCGSPYSLNLLKKSKILNNNFNQKFHFHPMIKVIAKFPKKVNSIKNANVINNQISEFFPNFLFGNAASNIEFLKIFAFGNSNVLNDIENNYEHMSMYHVTFSSGKSNFFKIPFIQEYLIKYSFDEFEKKYLNDGLIKLINFIFESGADYIYIPNKNNTKLTKSSNYSDIIKKNKFNLSSVHLLGGIKFGESDDCLFNSFGKFKSKKMNNLYVNDSSLLTEKLLKNPQGAIMEISDQNINEAIKNFNE